MLQSNTRIQDYLLNYIGNTFLKIKNSYMPRGASQQFFYNGFILYLHKAFSQNKLTDRIESSNSVEYTPILY